ncbi:hypothetical protein [Aquimarina algiphila]|uniref:hypothetical protein n=1 Tax=Aquimarina algiphila TaxID=2047982 RepID=UPI00117C25D5|nr:hypothetical protein [Aquimarina algiphila]
MANFLICRDKEIISLSSEEIQKLLKYTELFFNNVDKKSNLYNQMLSFFNSIYSKDSMFWIEQKDKQLLDIANKKQ